MNSEFTNIFPYTVHLIDRVGLFPILYLQFVILHPPLSSIKGKKKSLDVS